MTVHQEQEVSQLIAELREYIENMADKLEELTSYMHAEIEGVHEKLAGVERRLEERIERIPNEIDQPNQKSAQVEIPDEWFLKVAGLIEDMKVADRSYNERFLTELQELRDLYNKSEGIEANMLLQTPKRANRDKRKKSNASSNSTIEGNS